MVTVLVVVVFVGLGVALYEVASSRRRRDGDTRAQLDALSRVVDPQRRGRRDRRDDVADAAPPRPVDGVEPDGDEDGTASSD